MFTWATICSSKVRGLNFDGDPFVSLRDIRYAPTRWVLALFLGFVNFWAQCPKISYGMLFEICKKRPFQKCMGWEGG